MYRKKVFYFFRRINEIIWNVVMCKSLYITKERGHNLKGKPFCRGKCTNTWTKRFYCVWYYLGKYYHHKIIFYWASHEYTKYFPDIYKLQNGCKSVCDNTVGNIWRRWLWRMTTSNYGLAWRHLKNKRAKLLLVGTYLIVFPVKTSSFL